MSDKNVRDSIVVQMWCDSAPEYAKSFIKFKEKTVAVGTLRIYTNNISIFWKWLETKGLTNSLSDMCLLTEDLSKEFIDYILNEFTVSTTLSIISTVSSLYNDFVINKHMCVNPFSMIKRPKPEREETECLTDDELKSLLHVINTNENMSKRFIAQEVSHCTRYRNQSIAKILIDTCIKSSELIALNTNDVNISNNALRINKQNGSNIVHVKPDTMRTLKQWLDMRRLFDINPDEKALFIASQGRNKNERISPQTVDFLIKNYALAAGINNSNKFSPNKLRNALLCN